MNPLDPIVLELDDSEVVRGTKNANTSIDGYGAKVISVNRATGRSWEESMSRMVTANKNGFERMASDVERYAVSVKKVGEGVGDTFRALASATKGALEFAGAVALGAKAFAAQTTAAGVMEAALNRLRAARVGVAAFSEGLGGAAIVAGEIAAVVAIEKLAVLTLDRADQIRRDALTSARTGLGVNDVSALQFAGGRSGVDVNTLNSLARSSGGVSELAAKLKELGDIKDPVLQVTAAFREFGQDTPEILDHLNSRLGDNAAAFKSWREQIGESMKVTDTFRGDIQKLEGVFSGLGDTISFQLKAAGDLGATAFGRLYEMLSRDLPKGIGGLIPFAFTADTMNLPKPLNVDANTQAQVRQNLLNQYSGAGSKYFLKSQEDAREQALRSQIAKDQAALYDSDRTSPNYGRLIPGGSFPGGFLAQAQVQQRYVQDQQQLKGIVDARDAQKEADAARRQADGARESFEHRISDLLQESQQKELSGIDQIRQKYTQLRAEAGEKGATSSLGKIGLAEEFDKLKYYSQSAKEYDNLRNQMDREVSAGFRGKYVDAGAEPTQLTGPNSVYLQNLPFATNGRISQMEFEAQRQGIERQASQAGRLSDLANPNKTPADAYREQLTLVKQLSDLEKDNIQRTSSGLEQQVLLTQERLDTTRKLQDAAYEFQLKSAEAVRQQFDSVKSASSSLLDTLFNKPKDFARQLGDTIRQALLKPVVDSLSTSIAQTLTVARSGALVGLGSVGLLAQPATQKDWSVGGTHASISAALKESAPAGISKFSGLPVYFVSGKGDKTPLGEFDPQGGRINMYMDATKAQYSPGELPWGAARTLIHEDTHAVLDSKDIGSLNSLLPPDFVKKSMAGLVASGDYNQADAARELIPRLVTNEGTGSSGFDNSKILGQFLTSVNGSDPQLANTLRSLSTASGGIPSGRMLPSLNDLLIGNTQPLRDFPLAGNPAAGIGLGGTAGFTRGGISDLYRTMANGKGWHSNLASLKDTWWNENINTGPGRAVSASSLGLSGDLAGVLTSKGAAGVYTAVGVPLATAGLTGGRRGTWGGVGESTLGGALTGAGIGTMVLPGVGTLIGAGIGAAAGFAASTLSMLAGVESPENEAKRLAKSVYGINIDSQVARQIVQISQQSYGNRVSVAIRSPEVRNMLGLLASATGQKFPISATTPQAGSLSEQAGKLYQNETFKYGGAQAFQSSLPVSGGYSNPTTLPGFGGNPTLSINVNGTNVNPEFVQAQFSNSQQYSNNRLQNAALSQDPGLIIS